MHKVIILTDSKLLCKQVNGEYKVNNPWIAQMMPILNELKANFNSVEVAWISRNSNQMSDAKANETCVRSSNLDHEQGKFWIEFWIYTNTYF